MHRLSRNSFRLIGKLLVFFNRLTEKTARLLRNAYWGQRLCYIGTGTQVRGQIYIELPENVSIGDRCTLNHGTAILAQAPIRIGNDVRISPNVTLNTVSISIGGHSPNHSNHPQPIAIGDNVVIATGAQILPGVTIGEHSVVMAGAVVSSSIPPYALVGGVPAKIIRNIIEPVDRQFRIARLWSNRELRTISHLFTGDIVNVSAGKDEDKEGNAYADYFPNKSSYFLTNYGPGTFRGFQGRSNEFELDLTKELATELKQRFDVVFNHTTLEHIFDVRTAFNNICQMSRDIVIIVVPFGQVQHESNDYGDYWRFAPGSIRRMFEENSYSVVYEACNNEKEEAIYLFFVGSLYPDKWRSIMPSYEPITQAGAWIGAEEQIG